MKNEQPLLDTCVVGGIKLNNRIAMSPMTRSRSDNAANAPTALTARYYEQRASAGLLITEGSQISKQAVGYVNTPGIYSEAQTAAWRAVTDAVHLKGGKIFIQLWHVGRMSHPDFHNGELPLAPSAINPEGKAYTPSGFKPTVTPKAMTADEIRQTVADYGKAAANAVKAGFDGVEIHAANGYLLHQFLNRCSNTRTDEYGGSIEKRARILFDVLDEITKVMPAASVGVHLNPSLHGLFGMMLDEETIPCFDHIVRKLNNYGLAYLFLSEPFTDVTKVTGAEPHVARHFRPLYKGPLVINGGFDRETGNKVLAAGLADLVAFGKLYISNPDLAERFAEKASTAPWDEATFYTTGAKGYTDYPALRVKTGV